ncbi:MAG: ribosomal protein [Candidatus Midichloriaceae bacterium]|jgi:small subunit ribosomal protein S11|nr:30S ribosomal protein S11 [Candidatus Jidaibacter sp.]MDF3047841.1 ribosomal protein [Candidatus Midichloriaceae bacterium]
MAVTSSNNKIKKRVVPVAIVSINASFNNTIVSVTDQQGDVISWASAGNVGFKGSRKSTPYAGQMAAEKAFEEAIKYGVKTVSIRIKGPGAARESAVRAVSALVNKHQLAVISIKDVTPVPHNGCRRPKRRRV